MKNRITFIFALGMVGLTYAQIGINLATPKATLDISAKASTGKATAAEGLLIPRVDRERAQSMTNIATSTLIYVNSILTGSKTGIAVNIDAEGYYYFNGKEWVKLNVDQDNNLYNINGTLSGNRIVTQNSSSLSFNAEAINAFSINKTGTGAGNILSVDAANKRVGIGTIAPNADLQIMGTEMRLGGPATQSGSTANPVMRIHSNANKDASGGSLLFSENDPNYGYYIRHNTEAGAVYGMDGLAIGASQAGKYSFAPAKPGVFISDNQSVGFGTSTPQQVFHIDANRDNNINTAPTAAQASNDIVITNNGNMGIGTTSPNSKLDLGSTSSIKKLSVYNNASGTDFYGLGTSANTLEFRAGTTAANEQAGMVLRNNGRVGVGTTIPQATFHTLGTRRFENATPNSVAVGAVMTAVDNNGTAEWKTPVAEAVVGQNIAGAGIDIPFTNADGVYKYTGRYITLPPGRWAVTITQLAQISGALDNDDWMFVRSTFSEENLAINAVGTRSGDVTGGPTLMSFKVQGPATATNPQQFSVFQGTIFINNTSGGNKTYRYIAGSTVTGGSPNSATIIRQYGGGWSESSIYATAIK
ncbi:hypothetical protein [Chryseobacterium sp. JUb7]|uniref:hypothetical protein n=1 Tax=Chryseobacterium sp. JUb7 TaxID=2940599 RepID=UPI002169F212|nr:hypothetical protein [Chryseobacterium sp. JUb7]MCS3529904.1 hypothetical protein [Chryseobacterium sp. JUb7]